ncbi:40S ribosomal S2 protein2 [Fusarium denticulatum]|uniref:40S ribosomal S2 protein2 n=1 Tax=Fusarium denticulatum TaxID=48507 RepID=A0A8H5U5J6_9HYPO|nr:40S ribosomal S2 protein2 [Fusarium denticulatum]
MIRTSVPSDALKSINNAEKQGSARSSSALPPSLNKCGVISPRFNVRLGDLEKWVVRLLPARQFGHLVLTTSAGIMDHDQARRKHVSGKIIGYFY